MHPSAKTWLLRKRKYIAYLGVESETAWEQLSPGMGAFLDWQHNVTWLHFVRSAHVRGMSPVINYVLVLNMCNWALQDGR